MNKKNGFTILELIVSMAVIAVLFVVTLVYMQKAKELSKYSNAKSGLEAVSTSLQHYLNDYGNYPADVSRALPSGLEEYLPDGDWPNGPWTYSVYDWDNWTISGVPTHQISLRFCNANDGEVVCANKIPPIFPEFDKYSALYYCIDGSCRSHDSKPANHPGFCINCNLDESDFLWGGN